MHGDKVYVVGFSEAKARCGCEMTWDRVRPCPELAWVELQFGDGGTNGMLEEIGVPPGWKGCSAEATRKREPPAHNSGPMGPWNVWHGPL